MIRWTSIKLAKGTIPPVLLRVYFSNSNYEPKSSLNPGLRGGVYQESLSFWWTWLFWIKFIWWGSFAEFAWCENTKPNRVHANSTLANDWVGCLVEFNSFIFLLPLSDAQSRSEKARHGLFCPSCRNRYSTCRLRGHHLLTSRGERGKPGRQLHPWPAPPRKAKYQLRRCLLELLD